MTGVITEFYDRFNLSESLGFLLQDPADKLAEYFQAWDKIAGNMEELVRTQQVRQQVAQLPTLDTDKMSEFFSTERERYRGLRLAHLQLTTIMSGYVWSHGEEQVPKVLPQQIAVPLWDVCQKLGGLKPGISYTAVVQANHKILDESKPFRALNPQDNLRLISGKFIQNFGNDWFFLNSIQVEKDFAPALHAMLDAVFLKPKVCFSDYDAQLTRRLNILASSISRMTTTLERMPAFLDPLTYYTEFRPFMSGFTSGQYAEWGGLIFQGVDSLPKPLSGGSAAQSPIFQSIDAFLGVSHGGDFLRQMRDYMPAEHHALIEFFEKHTIRDTVLFSSDSYLQSAYNSCIENLKQFRDSHIRTVAQFIVAPKNKIMNAGGCPFAHQSSDGCSPSANYTVGTGGTNAMPFLKGVRDETKTSKLTYFTHEC